MIGQVPLVTIAMPVRNGERTLGLAIRSLLAQTLQNWKLIIIDDGSTDATLRVAKQFFDPRILVLADDHSRGTSARLNQAITLGEGDYFARMDADDVSYPWRLERQVNYLRAHPDVDLVGAWVIVFRGNGFAFGRHCPSEEHGQLCAKPIAGIRIDHPTWTGRMEFFRKYLYSDLAIRSEDQDLLLRAYRFSRFANVQEILLGYREDDLSLRKILRSRFFFSRNVVREFRRQRRPGMALRGVSEQVLKGSVDVFAYYSGLKYRIVRQRARPMTSADREQWDRVWRLANERAACEQI